MAKSQKPPVGRRGFLKNAAAGAAALVTTTPLVEAQAQQGGAGSTPAGPPAPTQAQIARESGDVRPPASVRKITRPGSDLMVQAIRDLGIEYVAANPGSSFEGLQESFINYGNPPNQMPEIHHRAA
jgi:acetolactate synthase-1/2/3 large subunit